MQARSMDVLVMLAPLYGVELADVTERILANLTGILSAPKMAAFGCRMLLVWCPYQMHSWHACWACCTSWCRPSWSGEGTAQGGRLDRIPARPPRDPPKFLNLCFSNLRFWGKVSAPKALKAFFLPP